jgi:hypothetical protein
MVKYLRWVFTIPQNFTEVKYGGQSKYEIILYDPDCIIFDNIYPRNDDVILDFGFVDRVPSIMKKIYLIKLSIQQCFLINLAKIVIAHIFFMLTLVLRVATVLNAQ